MKIILGLMVVLILMGSAAAISVSMSTDLGSVGTVLNAGDNSQISGYMLASGAGVLSQAGGSGDVTIGQSANGGGQSVGYVAQTVGGGDISSEIGATEGGVFGKMDYEGTEALSYGEVATLAKNPNMALEKNTLTRSGAVLRINGGEDITSKWYVDPAQNFRIGIYYQDTINQQGYVLPHERLKGFAQNWANTINAATGLPVIDSIYETTYVSWGGSPDYKNSLMFSYLPDAYNGYTATWYDTGSRKVVDSDTALNQKYMIYLDTMDRVTAHEMFHTAGMLDYTAARYPGLAASSTIMGTARYPTALDKNDLWNKYNR